MRSLSWLSLSLAILGWTAWFVICNVYEFAPRLDPWAFVYGWLLAVIGGVVLRPWGRCGLAACIGLYLLLIHRNVGADIALATLVISSILVLAIKRTRRVP